MESCPGWYCGRVLQENGKLSECRSCPRGFKRNDTTFICDPCLHSPELYDWLYLGFMVLIVLTLHCFFIDMVSMRLSKKVLSLHISAFCEVFLSCVLALLFTDPYGSFQVYSCQTVALSDWYTLLHNPRPNYDIKIYCTQEAVYPFPCSTYTSNFGGPVTTDSKQAMKRDLRRCCQTYDGCLPLLVNNFASMFQLLF